MMTREKKLQEQQERRQLKEYVLGYEGREDADERHGECLMALSKAEGLGLGLVVGV